MLKTAKIKEDPAITQHTKLRLKVLPLVTQCDASDISCYGDLSINLDDDTSRGTKSRGADSVKTTETQPEPRLSTLRKVTNDTKAIVAIETGACVTPYK